MTGSQHISSGLLWLAAALPNWSVSCQWLIAHEERVTSSYAIEVRCRTQDGAPVPNVLLTNPESGASGLTDWQGRLGFRIEGYEGTEVSFRVERTPTGIVQADDSATHRLVLKSIVSSKNGEAKRGLITYDIPMRKSRENYVVFVSTHGVPNLPVLANGIPVGRLNSLGAGAFRVQGQPGEELKVVIQTGEDQPKLSQQNPERTFTLPPLSSILSFSSTLSGLPESVTTANAEKPVITFVPKKQRGHHSRKKQPKEPERTEQPAHPGPVQIPFRGIEVK